ncbi:MAG: hypothetical protein Q4Q31_10165 [Bacillota bacterium]|nr:hypothetical protein [Bacillota bacterium]
MKMKIKNIFNKYIDTKQKKVTIGVIVSILGGIGVVLNIFKSHDLILITDTQDVELGQTVSTNINDYLDHDKVSGELVKKIIKDTEEKDNLKYVKVVNKDENGNIVSKEEKDYPEVGNYEINFTYKNESATVKITVKDTTKPEIKAPESIDIVQYTDLSTFNFGELLEVTDYSDVKEWKIDTSKVDINTIGSYKFKVSIQDQYKNKTTKTLNVNVVEAPIVNEGEVAVTEVITDENGNKKTIVAKRWSDEISSKDSVASTFPVSNKGTIKSEATNTKPTTNNGINATTNNTTSSSNKGGSDLNNTSHTHNYNIPIIKVVHHDDEIKIVHHDAVVENQPVYEEHIVCKVCHKDFGKYGGANADDHSGDTGHSYESKDVQVGTRQVTVKEAYNENIVVKQAYDEMATTGYKCSCGVIK